jgi:sodium transport system permease protein
MNRGKIGIVFWKEAIDTLRDSRSLFLIFIIPLVMYPAMFTFMGFVLRGEKTKQEATVVTVGFTDGSRAPRLREHLAAVKGIRLLDTPAESTAVHTGDVDAVVRVPGTLEVEGAPPDTAAIVLYYDSSKDHSKLARRRTMEALEAYRKSEMERAFARIGADRALLRQGQAAARDLVSAERAGASLLGNLIPYMLVVLISIGAFHTGIDSTAGEKERNTLETILVSSASRTELVFGKYLATFVASIVTAVMGMIGLGATFMSNLSILTMDESSPIAFAPSSALVLFATMIPVAALVSALLILIGCFAKSTREGQTYASYLQMVLIVLALMSTMKTTDVSTSTYLMPIMNVTLLQKEMLLGTLNPTHVLLSMASTLLMAAVTLFLALKLFENEKVLFRTK